MMTEKEAEKAYKDMAKEDMPELWPRIEKRLVEMEEAATDTANDGLQAETRTASGEKKHGVHGVLFLHKLKKIMFGGSALRSAVSVCMCCLIIFAAFGGISNLANLSARYESSSSGAATADDEVYYEENAAVAEDYSTDSKSPLSSGIAVTASDDYTSGSAAVSSDDSSYDSAAISPDNTSVASSDGSADDSSAVSSDGSADDSSATSSDGSADGSEDDSADTSDRKLIRTINMEIETKIFDDYIQNLTDQVKAAGGYVESSNISSDGYTSGSYGASYYSDGSSSGSDGATASASRHAEIVFRIPQDKTDSFLENIGNDARITYKSENVEDITLTYVDTESKIKALQTEEDTLLDLLKKAESVEDILAIQNELSNVRYELESYQSQLKTYDNQIYYDTLTLNVQEVGEETSYTEPTLGERIIQGFKNSLENLTYDLQNLLVTAVIILPYFAVFFIAVFLIICFIRFIRRHRKKK